MCQPSKSIHVAFQLHGDRIKRHCRQIFPNEPFKCFKVDDTFKIQQFLQVIFNLNLANLNIVLDSEGANIIVGPGHSRPEIDVLSSTPAPPQSSLLFAFGTSHGIITMEKEDSRPSYFGRRDVLHQTFPKDIFALEFLADNHNVLLSGGMCLGHNSRSLVVSRLVTHFKVSFRSKYADHGSMQVEVAFST
jgi:hypothetical protein